MERWLTDPTFSPRISWVYWGIAAALVLVGVFLPRGWYDTLPRPTGMTPEGVKGVTLLQISFVLEGLAFIWLAASRWTFVRLTDADRLAAGGVPGGDDGANRWVYVGLAAIVVLGAGLRLLHLGSDLWGDEINPLVDYAGRPALQVITTYLDSGNHLLNTLLVNASIARFGQQEWAMRLPAVIFGIATIPVMYWVGSLVLPRRGALGAALLLAVSYHHIFFSQNARAYSAYLLFALLASGLLVKGLQEDRPSTWALYGGAIFLDMASVLNSAYVLGAHAVVGLVALFVIARRSRHFPVNLLKRLIIVFGGVGLLTFQLYATMLPQAAFMARVWTSPASGYRPFSGEFLRELVRGVSAGFGPGVLVAALPFLVIAGAGFVVLLRRQWALTLALTLPEVLTAAFLSAKGYTFAPRLFLLALPVAILAAVGGIFWLSDLVCRGLGMPARTFPSGVALTLVAVLSLVSLASLGRYYAVPKQPFRASVHYVLAQRKTEDVILVSYLAGTGFRFYGGRSGLVEGRDFFVVRRAAEVDAILTAHRGTRSFFVTTLPRLVHLSYPDLESRIAAGWRPIRRFRGTIGGGDITIWEER
jgi:mannosyltransferase